MGKKKILVIEQNEDLRQTLLKVLSREGFDGETALAGKEACEKLEREDFQFILADLDSLQMESFDFLEQVRAKSPNTLVLVASAQQDMDLAIAALKSGAYDFLNKPFRTEEVLLSLRKAEERENLKKESGRDQTVEGKERPFSDIVAKNRSMLEIFKTIQKISEYKTTCLILGESGTGKELIARAIHYNSSRSEKPFITVNCGAIPENLLESELFGHIKGSFTGAVRTKKGLFEEADQGTLFLDEIGELPLLLQVKLLRALQEEEIRKVGDTNAIKINVRIVAATVKDLVKEVEKGTFREDLFYRLNVLPIYIPSLRERKEDIPMLVNHFIEKMNQKISISVRGVDPSVMKVILDHDWPGNVRELENVIERAMVLVSDDQIRLENLPGNIRTSQRTAKGASAYASEELSIKKMSRIMEEDLIVKALARARGNRTQAAKLLEISHRALLYKIKRYQLETSITDASA